MLRPDMKGSYNPTSQYSENNNESKPVGNTTFIANVCHDEEHIPRTEITCSPVPDGSIKDISNVKKIDRNCRKNAKKCHSTRSLTVCSWRRLVLQKAMETGCGLKEQMTRKLNPYYRAITMATTQYSWDSFWNKKRKNKRREIFACKTIKFSHRA